MAVLSVEIADDGVGGADPAAGSGLRGLDDRVAAIGGTPRGHERARRRDGDPGGDPVRVVLADDAVLFREALASALDGRGDRGRWPGRRRGRSCWRLIADTEPDAAVVDVRMPPTRTTEGLDAAALIRERHPSVGLLILSQNVETRHVLRLLRDTPQGVGYLLKDRVGNLAEFVDALGASGAADPWSIRRSSQHCSGEAGAPALSTS